MRCAIYTRKSADERADSVLSSTETQRELCAAYVASQAHEGWVALAELYDDVGFSGATLDRPALDRLLTDIAGGAIDTVVVYKIDRLSRSLRDFLNLLARLEAAHVHFVSITQSLDTSSPVGRLMLNILLSFAQFERDLIGERARDWKASARARGLWASGPPPLGYRVEQLRLVVDAKAAVAVRQLYRDWPKAKSYAEMADRLNRGGHTNRMGGQFTGAQVKVILTNRVYRGDLTYRGQPIPGFHDAIITERQWTAAQRAVAKRDASPLAIAGRAGRAKRGTAS